MKPILKTEPMKITDEQIEKRYNEIIDDPMYGETARPLAKWVRDQYEAEGKEQQDIKYQIGELMAIMHGDGGHYQENHGLLKAIEDAKELIHTKYIISPLHQSEEAKPTYDQDYEDKQREADQQTDVDAIMDSKEED